MQTISHLPPLSVPSSAEAASSIIGGSLYVQLYNVLQTNMLQRVNSTHPSNNSNENPESVKLC
jgi:serine/threonine-protein kinase OSR1/STK39